MAHDKTFGDCRDQKDTVVAHAKLKKVSENLL